MSQQVWYGNLAENLKISENGEKNRENTPLQNLKLVGTPGTFILPIGTTAVTIKFDQTL